MYTTVVCSFINAKHFMGVYLLCSVTVLQFYLSFKKIHSLHCVKNKLSCHMFFSDN